METKSVNFLRGVPAQEALEKIIPAISKGYETAVSKYGADVLQYGHFTGFKPLRDIIGNLHGVDPNRVVAGNGGLEVISLFFKSLPKESLILVEETSYDRVLLDAVHYGHRLAGIPLTPDGVDLDRFKEAVKKMRPKAFYGIPFHQNPTGITYSRDNRKAVEQICKKNDIFCIWDVCYQVLRYDGKTNDAVEISDWGPMIASSFTKTITPGTKCGYIIVPEAYVNHFTQVIANTRINPNLPTQAFITDFIRSGQYDEYLQYLTGFYRPRMDALNHALKTHFPGSFPSAVSGGFFAALTFSGVSKEKEIAFIEAAKKNGVSIAPAWDAVAPDFKDDMQKKGLFIRLTFPALDPGSLEWGILKLKETVDSFG
ncbi:MAG: PLP-dependent aminotransferase family protein [Desulfobacula sp.]|jgi:DNA-binding transcriptional MocR family regulator